MLNIIITIGIPLALYYKHRFRKIMSTKITLASQLAAAAASQDKPYRNEPNQANSTHLMYSVAYDFIYDITTETSPRCTWLVNMCIIK